MNNLLAITLCLLGLYQVAASPASDRIAADVAKALAIVNAENGPDRVLEAPPIFTNYGCWCYFTDGLASGHGTAVDELDQLCKLLHGGYQCAQLDNGDSCVPWEIEYSSFFGTTNHYSAAATVFQNLGHVQTSCQNFNPSNSCAAAACMVEGYFVIQFVDLVRQNLISQSNFVDNGFQTDSCRAPGSGNGGTAGPIECCGLYPTRFPYASQAGRKQCCDVAGVTYDSAFNVCCADGSIKASC